MTETTRAADTTPAPVNPVPSPQVSAPPSVVDAVARVVHADLERLAGTVVERTLAPLAEVIERARTAHEKLLGRLRADIGDGTAWSRVVQYRQEVTDLVVEAIETQVSGTAGESIGQACLDVLVGWEAASGDFPETVHTTAPATLYAAATGDPMRHRVGKAVMRRRRAMAKIGRRLRDRVRSGDSPDSEATRTIPLRLLVDFHCRVRLAGAVHALHEELQQQTAQHLSAVVEAVAQWTEALLVLEHEGDHAALHQPRVLAERWPAPEPETKESEDAGPVDPGDRLLAAAEALQEALRSATALRSLAVAADPALLDAASAELERDVQRGGTFLVPARSRRAPVGGAAPVEKLQRRMLSWADWHTRAHNRLALAHELLDLRRDLIGLNESLLGDTAEKTLVPLFDTFDAIREELRNAQAHAEQTFGQEDDPVRLARAMRGFQKSTLRAIERATGESQAILSATNALAEPGRQEWERLDLRIERLPGELLVHELAEGKSESIDPEETAFSINLVRIARQALEPPWPVLLRPAAAGLRKSVSTAWGGAEQVLNIVQYNLGAALDELEATADVGETSKTETPADAAAAPDPVDSAKQLAADALRRSVDVLDDLERGLQPPWYAFATKSVDALKDDWSALLRRVRSEDSRQEKWVGLQTGISRSAERFTLDVRERWGAGLRAVGRFGRLAYRWIERLARRGRAAVGVPEAASEDRLGATDAITAAEQRLNEFPLVYRRLFSFAPLTEGTLLEGRARDLVRVRRHFDRWKEQNGAGVAILPGPLGSGRTTLLNVIEQTVFEGCQTHQIRWRARVESERDLAASIGEALDVGSIADPPSLDALEHHLRKRPRGAQPTVVLIDELEHLFLQVPGGCDLIERFLIFLARTDSQVYWIASIGREAWQYLEKTATTAVGFVTSLPLTALDRTRLEEIILSRHRRSGMELRFVPADKTTALMRQRLRRARTAEAKQALLQEAFFDGLFKAADQQVALGLFYWLRASQVDEEEDAILVHPAEPLDFGFLAGLDLTRLFTLKAFLVHRTLALTELDRLLRLPPDQGILILESLLSLQLIEPMPGGGESRTGPPDVTTQRFRLRPLMIRPVIAQLMSKRIVY